MAAIGCGGGGKGSGVAVTLDATGKVAAVSSLSVRATNNGQTSTPVTFTLPKTTDIPPAQTFTLDFTADRTGMVTILVDARDGAGQVLATSSGTGILSPGNVITVNVTLPGVVTGDMSTTPGDGGVDAAAADLTVSPDLKTPPDMTPGWQVTSITANRLGGVWGNGSGEVYAVGNNGTIVHSFDNGTTWMTETSNTGFELFSVWGSTSGDVWAVGFGNTILHSTGTNNWAAQTPNISESALDSVWGTSKLDVYVAAGAGNVLHSSDIGQTWTTATTGLTGQRLWAMGGLVGNEAYALGNSGAILRKQGGSWTSISGQVDSCYNVTVPDANNVYAACSMSILASRDHGTTWSSIQATQSRGIFAVGNDVFVTAPNVKILHSADKGATWTTITTPLTGTTTNPLYGMWGTSASDYYAVGEGGILLHFH